LIIFSGIILTATGLAGILMRVEKTDMELEEWEGMGEMGQDKPGSDKPEPDRLISEKPGADRLRSDKPYPDAHKHFRRVDAHQGYPDGMRRCPWADTEDALMREYHDAWWGRPCRDEGHLFEMLTLEGAQAGLSWATILHKRENYRRAFDGWDIERIAAYDAGRIEELLREPGIVRNRLKVASVVTNARAVLKLGSLADFIWNYVDGEPIVNAPESMADLPATTPLSDRISKDMKKLGFSFIGSTVIYSFLQSVGVVNDHMAWCDFRPKA
jgi:DNA-3-methyladenine glycosylase I